MYRESCSGVLGERCRCEVAYTESRGARGQLGEQLGLSLDSGAKEGYQKGHGTVHFVFIRIALGVEWRDLRWRSGAGKSVGRYF